MNEVAPAIHAGARGLTPNGELLIHATTRPAITVQKRRVPRRLGSVWHFRVPRSLGIDANLDSNLKSLCTRRCILGLEARLSDKQQLKSKHKVQNPMSKTPQILSR